MLLLLPLTILILHLGSAWSNPISSVNVTIWQFGGAHRLVGGISTEPLQAIGTASGGLATTYLYQALTPQVQTVTTGTKNQTLTETVTLTRTMVISASGWIETPAPSVVIQCSFVSGTDGVCFDQTSTASGAAASDVLQVSMPSPPAVTTSFPATLSTPGSSAPASTSPTSTSTLPNSSGSSGSVTVTVRAVGAILLLHVLAMIWIL
ncbi:hypothetical protein D9757_014451 [Collybiopsis confluens]|uniref:Uncharacterized protein n=1 Tax=Collybiopsis confluens TaxID=2823264 RepID=A0A8H5CSD5_9AGAR|nr:hypothetical protein D9757_013653 [Collybiopsis confluens]KAF5350287.1 hypothetical protein D9757_014451 [Collybiopsis confluens]